MLFRDKVQKTKRRCECPTEEFNVSQAANRSPKNESSDYCQAGGGEVMLE
jgi:hypothetical protein